jgi:hypothetical protein
VKVEPSPKSFSSVPGKTATHEPSATHSVVSLPAIRIPQSPNGTRYGGGASWWLKGSLMAAGKIQR